MNAQGESRGARPELLHDCARGESKKIARREQLADKSDKSTVEKSDSYPIESFRFLLGRTVDGGKKINVQWSPDLMIFQTYRGLQDSSE